MSGIEFQNSPWKGMRKVLGPVTSWRERGGGVTSLCHWPWPFSDIQKKKTLANCFPLQFFELTTKMLPRFYFNLFYIINLWDASHFLGIKYVCAIHNFEKKMLLIVPVDSLLDITSIHATEYLPISLFQ